MMMTVLFALATWQPYSGLNCTSEFAGLALAENLDAVVNPQKYRIDFDRDVTIANDGRSVAFRSREHDDNQSRVTLVDGSVIHFEGTNPITATYIFGEYMAVLNCRGILRKK